MPNGVQLAVWYVQEPVTELYAQSLPEWQREAANFGSEHRQAEWLAVRLLLQRILSLPIPAIVYDAYRHPFLEPPTHRIAISHTRKWVAIGLHKQYDIGIDIQVITEKVFRIKERFLHFSELTALTDKAQLWAYTLCWSAKETLYKLQGKKELHFKDHIRLKIGSIHTTKPDFIGTGSMQAILLHQSSAQYYTVYFEVTEGYVLTIVKDDSEA